MGCRSSFQRFALTLILSPLRWMPDVRNRMKGGYQEVPRLELNQSRRPSTGFKWTIRAIIFTIFALLFYFTYRFVLTMSDQGLSERERAALKEGPTYDAKPTTKKIDRGTRPHMTVAIPIPGKMTCPGPVIKPSAKTPTDVNQVRPADITYVAALGDSITTGSLSYDLPEEFTDDDRNFVGNSFDMGGDGGLETHLTLPNVLRHVNPALVGFSMGKGLEVEHAQLNVAFPGRTNTGTPKDQYKAFLREAIVTIQKGLPRSIISLIGMWNLDFQWRAAKIIYNTTYKCSSNFDTIAQARIVEYREAINELSADSALQSKTQAVVVQRVFDDLTEPLKRADGSYDANFYATDVFHLSKYGNSLVAKQLWKQLIQPVGGKSTTNSEMADNDGTLACPDKDCPFIRTIVNSQNCVIPDYNVTTAKPK
ncbi:hypothetical protein PRIPAC_75449 [Pristionchus pacificus]|uniref:Lipase n=1 Tax=Pristionchus pacificus TaxID=54126 RepID=A0A2A6C5Y6_PRIPA|nr:hypothetical protein PRIPAC_75449 [Pristionchus pacificus]|eukprot:PDM73550.1 lipase [Pristionchus pacificus]